jgi:3-hydroxymyristoyl/3-hydroxydecanoyl-(acyl carrier protein) dehydratase
MWWEKMTMNEGFFVGHFPEAPVMPGVLIKGANRRNIKALSRSRKLFDLFYENRQCKFKT